MNLTKESYISLLKLWVEAINTLLEHWKRPVKFKRLPTAAENAEGKYTDSSGAIHKLEDEAPAFLLDPEVGAKVYEHGLALGILQGLIAELETTPNKALPLSDLLEVIKMLRAVGVRTHRLSRAAYRVAFDSEAQKKVATVSNARPT